ncbi:MAG: ferritin-like domain-containing protein [Alphaproteobacteria bacterium]|nr:ferritin-like domain-containing protein [Alphaproteobacteria bacterium]
MTHPYAPPKARLDKEAPPDPTPAAQRLRVRRPWTLLALAATSLASAYLLPSFDAVNSGQRVEVFLTLLIATFVFGGLAALTGLVAVFRIPRASPWVKLGMVLGPALGGGFFFFAGAALTVFVGVAMTRGRQLRRRGQVLLPPVEAGPGWSAEPLEAHVPEAQREALAEAWRENARTEHASVAAFARLTLQLMALGAPSELIAAAQKDAEEELRHTHLCFSLARGIDGREAGPGAFEGARLPLPGGRSRRMALVTLAVESLVDGALNEGVSARIVGRLARQVEDPAVKAVLTEIASDEGRHAVHGWDVLRWCHAQDPDAVGQALAGALRALPERFADTLPPGAADGGWERFGIPGQALADEEYAKTRDHVARRVRGLIEARQAA